VSSDELTYQTGFGNTFTSEALPGAVPPRINGPRKRPYGLYHELINGTGFTVERALNHRVWLYRLRPQIAPNGWTHVPSGRFAGRFDEGVASPDLIKLAAQRFPAAGTDFIAGIETFAGAGDPSVRTGMAIHRYAATADMENSAFCNSDGDMLVVPQQGALRIQTELGWLHVEPGEIALLPRGIRFAVKLPDGVARGFISEVFNGHYRLPERGVVGSNGLADERHFKAPVAAYEDSDVPHRITVKQGGQLWQTTFGHSPFDVVGWHGSYTPFKYDLMDFSSFWGVNWDHSDPSIHTVLSCPHDDHGRGAADFIVFRGRWDATEDTFRPPFPHRNSAVEFNSIIKAPHSRHELGSVTYTPYLAPHGPTLRRYQAELAKSDEQANKPVRGSDDELWIQFESTYQLRVMPWVLDSDELDDGFLDEFQGFPKAPLE